MSTTTAPGPGDLTRVGDPQHFTPGCPACDGHHPVSRCPANRPRPARPTCQRCGNRPTFAAGFPCPDCARTIRQENAT